MDHWINPLQTLSQGLVFTLSFTFGPELDKIFKICSLDVDQSFEATLQSSSIKVIYYLYPSHVAGSVVTGNTVTPLFMLVVSAPAPSHETADQVHWDWEHDGRVILSGDAAQGLQVAQLQRCRVVHDHLGRVLQSSAGLVFPLGSDHLGPSVPGGLSLRCHGSHQLLRNPDQDKITELRVVIFSDRI